jgi:hypothetical protein
LGSCIGADVPDERASSAKLDGPAKGLKDDRSREAEATVVGVAASWFDLDDAVV